MTTASQIFSPAQRATLTAALNRLIPSAPDRPAAGDLGLADFVEQAAAGRPARTRLFIEGLAAIGIAADHAHADGFAALPAEGQDAVLRQVEASHPAFFDELVLQTYNGYYTHSAVHAAIGYNVPGAAAPVEQLELLDESLLERQRQRAPFWTRV